MSNVNIAIALDEHGEHWEADCPKCGKTYEYKGWFDPEDKYKCDCGAIFKVAELHVGDKGVIR